MLKQKFCIVVGVSFFLKRRKVVYINEKLLLWIVVIQIVVGLEYCRLLYMMVDVGNLFFNGYSIRVFNLLSKNGYVEYLNNLGGFRIGNCN